MGHNFASPAAQDRLLPCDRMCTALPFFLVSPGDKRGWCVSVGHVLNKQEGENPTGLGADQLTTAANIKTAKRGAPANNVVVRP